MMSRIDVNRFLAQTEHIHKERITNHVLPIITEYKGLELSVDKYAYPDGKEKVLVCVSGTIPVLYTGVTYQTPISIWLTDTYPVDAPVCFVRPTKDQQIKPSDHVDASGQVSLQYIKDWRAGASHLLGLMEEMIKAFSESPPLCLKWLTGADQTKCTPVPDVPTNKRQTPNPSATAPIITEPVPTEQSKQEQNQSGIVKGVSDLGLGPLFNNKVWKIMEYEDKLAHREKELDEILRSLSLAQGHSVGKKDETPKVEILRERLMEAEVRADKCHEYLEVLKENNDEMKNILIKTEMELDRCVKENKELKDKLKMFEETMDLTVKLKVLDIKFKDFEQK